MALAEKLVAFEKEETDKLRHDINEAWKTMDSSHSRE
jgi:hypothetical protein